MSSTPQTKGNLWKEPSLTAGGVVLRNRLLPKVLLFQTCGPAFAELGPGRLPGGNVLPPRRAQPPTSRVQPGKPQPCWGLSFCDHSQSASPRPKAAGLILRSFIVPVLTVAAQRYDPLPAPPPISRPGRFLPIIIPGWPSLYSFQ